MAILKKLENFQLAGIESSIRPDQRREFEGENAGINFFRTRILATALLLIHLPLLYRDVFDFRDAGLWQSVWGYEHLFYAHVVLILFCTLYLLAAAILKRKSQLAAPAIQRVSYAFIVVTLYWAAFLAAYIAHTFHGQISEYIIAVLVVVAAFHLSLRASLLIFASGQLVFLGVLFYAADDPNANGHVTNTTALSVIAIILSNLIFRGHRRNFSNRKTIEEQKATLVESHKELEERNAVLHRLNQEKNELMAIVAHDLKNPLQAISLALGNIQHYADKMTPQEMQRQFGFIDSSSRRMLGLVNDLLDENALASGSYSIHTEQVSLHDLTKRIVDSFAQAALRKSIELRFEAPGPDVEIHSDPQRLEQILSNLISNAIKFSDPQTQTTVEIRMCGTNVVIEVRDQGPGISEADQQQLYQRFTRLTARPTGGEHSSGLGLSIVKKIVDSLGGSIKCSSTPGEGTCFSVTLPRTASGSLKVSRADDPAG